MTLSDFTQAEWIEIGISAGIIFFTWLLGRWILEFILERIVKRITHQTGTKLDDVLVHTFKDPLYWIALVAAIQYALSRLDFWTATWDFTLADIYFVVYVLIAFLVARRLVNNLVKWYREERAPKGNTRLDEQVMPLLSRFTQILIFVIASIMLLGYFEVDVSGIVATLGISSLAIALAAQAALSDIITGILIMIDRPYRIGDRIEILDLDTWGDVVDIGLRSTRVRTRDNRMVTVPNSVIGKSLIVNYSFPDSQYRSEVEVGIGYDSDIELARQVIIEAVSKVDGVLQDLPVEALFLRFGDSSLIFRVRWWLDSYVDTRRMFDSVNTAIHKALSEAGIEMPFPQRELHHRIGAADAEKFSALFEKKS
jgi:MscS family membrane protein